MKCPECGADTHVLSTRRGSHRRRECFNEHRFSTDETVAVSSDDEDDLYARLESLSKSLEGSGRIDEHDSPGAYATILDAMNALR